MKGGDERASYFSLAGISFFFYERFSEAGDFSRLQLNFANRSIVNQIGTSSHPTLSWDYKCVVFSTLLFSNMLKCNCQDTLRMYSSLAYNVNQI